MASLAQEYERYLWRTNKGVVDLRSWDNRRKYGITRLVVDYIPNSGVYSPMELEFEDGSVWRHQDGPVEVTAPNLPKPRGAYALDAKVKKADAQEDVETQFGEIMGRFTLGLQKVGIEDEKARDMATSYMAKFVMLVKENS